MGIVQQMGLKAPQSQFKSKILMNIANFGDIFFFLSESTHITFIHAIIIFSLNSIINHFSVKVC